MKHDDDIDDLRRLAPTLHGLRKQEPFRMEEGLFEQLPRTAVTTGRTRTMPAGVRWAMAGLVIALVGAAIHWSTAHVDQGTANVAEMELPVLTDEELEILVHDADHLLVEETTEVVWDTVPVTLSDDELLAYIEHEDLRLHEIITYLE